MAESAERGPAKVVGELAASVDRYAEPAHSGNGLDRVVFFSDAVAAIAITLVVLPLVDAAQGLAHESALHYFQANAYGLLAAGVSFLSIGGYWRDHHRLFESIGDYSSLLIRLDLLWLAGIVFLPIATIVLVTTPHGDPLAIGLYTGVLALILAMLNLIELHAVKAGLLRGSKRPSRVELMTRWIGVVLRLLAGLVAVLFPVIGLWTLVIALFETPIRRLILRAAHRSERAAD